MQKYKGNIKTNFWWIVPLIIGVSKNNVNNRSTIYSLHITPFFEICFNYKGTRNAYDVVSSDVKETKNVNKKEEVKKILQSKFKYTEDVLADQISKIYEEN